MDILYLGEKRSLDISVIVCTHVYSPNALLVVLLLFLFNLIFAFALLFCKDMQQLLKLSLYSHCAGGIFKSHKVITF